MQGMNVPAGRLWAGTDYSSESNFITEGVSVTAVGPTELALSVSSDISPG